MPGKMPDDVIFTVNAAVSRDGVLNNQTQANHSYSFEQVRAAMILIRDDLNRNLEMGSTLCPFRDHKGRA